MQQQNCQNWIVSFVAALVHEKFLPDCANDVVREARKNRIPSTFQSPLKEALLVQEHSMGRGENDLTSVAQALVVQEHAEANMKFHGPPRDHRPSTPKRTNVNNRRKVLLFLFLTITLFLFWMNKNVHFSHSLDLLASFNLALLWVLVLSNHPFPMRIVCGMGAI